MHAALRRVLASCSISSKFGNVIRCGDGKERVVYFAINAISADLDEAWKLTLTRGVTSSFGVCPICHVPKNCQHDLDQPWPLRNTAHARDLYNKATSLLSRPRNKGRAEKLLHDNGYYYAEVNTLI